MVNVVKMLCGIDEGDVPVVVAVDVAVVEMISKSPEDTEARPSKRFKLGGLGGILGANLEGGVGGVFAVDDFLDEENAPKTEESNEETPEVGECLSYGGSSSRGSGETDWLRLGAEAEGGDGRFRILTSRLGDDDERKIAKKGAGAKLFVLL